MNALSSPITEAAEWANINWISTRKKCVVSRVTKLSSDARCLRSRLTVVGLRWKCHFISPSYQLHSIIGCNTSNSSRVSEWEKNIENVTREILNFNLLWNQWRTSNPSSSTPVLSLSQAAQKWMISQSSASIITSPLNIRPPLKLALNNLQYHQWGVKLSGSPKKKSVNRYLRIKSKFMMIWYYVSLLKNVSNIFDMDQPFPHAHALLTLLLFLNFHTIYDPILAPLFFQMVHGFFSLLPLVRREVYW